MFYMAATGLRYWLCCLAGRAVFSNAPNNCAAGFVIELLLPLPFPFPFYYPFACSSFSLHMRLLLPLPQQAQRPQTFVCSRCSPSFDELILRSQGHILSSHAQRCLHQSGADMLELKGKVTALVAECAVYRWKS